MLVASPGPLSLRKDDRMARELSGVGHRGHFFWPSSGGWSDALRAR